LGADVEENQIIVDRLKTRRLKTIYRTATNLAKNPKFFGEISTFPGEGLTQRV
jgi:hypothetical protein